MPRIESYDTLPPAELEATDYIYVSKSEEPAGSRDQRFAFSTIVRALFAAADEPEAREALGIVTATATLNFPSIAAAATADLTMTVTGAALGDVVILGLPDSPAAGIVFFAFVSAADTVKVRAMNITGSGVDPASAIYRATVIKSA